MPKFVMVDRHRLPDGRIVSIRSIRADDSDRLRESHVRLSDRSRYRRFMSAKPQLSRSDARYLAEVDGRDHVALVATVVAPGGDAIVAVARLIRLPDSPAVAEFAIVVNDAWQGQGLGGELLARLGEEARARGVARFRASMLAENAPIHDLIARYAGGGAEHRRSGTVCEVEFDLREPGGRAAAPMRAVPERAAA